jgi:LPXTG-motif cell wall-anchored protein
LTVKTAGLPAGTVGVKYHQKLHASGAADGIYHWSIAAGSLPDGLTLSDTGVISGTPTTAGTFSFTVSVNDPATADLSITVSPATSTSTPPTSTPTTPPTSTPTTSPTTTPTASTPTGPSTTTVIAGTGTLPMTGVPGSTLPVGIAGLGLLLAGGLALVVAYRRRPGQH